MLLDVKIPDVGRLNLLQKQRLKVDVESTDSPVKLTLLPQSKLALGALILLYFLSMPSLGLETARGADRVLVVKSERMLYLLRDGEPYRRYPVSLGSVPQGPKQFAGDERTPEGLYWLEHKNLDSPFYRSIRISYPNAADRSHAAAQGRDPGGSIMVHGQPRDSLWPDDVALLFNWTDGCIAVSNRAMEEIWTEVAVGTLIEIRP